MLPRTQRKFVIQENKSNCYNCPTLTFFFFNYYITPIGCHLYRKGTNTNHYAHKLLINIIYKILKNSYFFNHQAQHSDHTKFSKNRAWNTKSTWLCPPKSVDFSPSMHLPHSQRDHLANFKKLTILLRSPPCQQHLFYQVTWYIQHPDSIYYPCKSKWIVLYKEHYYIIAINLHWWWKSTDHNNQTAPPPPKKNPQKEGIGGRREQ